MAAGVAVGTPSYGSPEQVIAAELDVSLARDSRFFVLCGSGAVQHGSLMHEISRCKACSTFVLLQEFPHERSGIGPAWL